MTTGPATRQIYWNISYHWLLYLFMLLPLVFLGYGLWRRYRMWRLGGPDQRYGDWWERVRTVLWESGLQRRVLRDLFPGLTHAFIVWGMVALFGGTLVVMAQADAGLPIYHGWFYLTVSLILDVFGALCLLGVVVAAFRRYALRPARLDSRPDDVVFLGILFVLLVSGFVLEGLRIAARPDPWGAYNPVGVAFSLPFAGWPAVTLASWYVVLWWGHLAVAFAFMAYLPFSKALHILVAPLNQFFRRLGPVGALSKLDFEDETIETFGVSQVTQFSWKHLMDADACTRCGRCQDNCPAHLSGKTLSPKALAQGVKAQMEWTFAHRGGKDGAAAAGRDADEGPKLIGGRIPEEALWACTTCRACEESCPVFVEHVEKTVSMRRHLVMMESQFPPELQLTFKNLETNFNPWALGWAGRADWRKELAGGEAGFEVPLISEHPNPEYLLWVGCSGSFDARNRKVTLALARLLHRAGVDFAILGTEEKCCGDSARRLGNEYLYQTLAQENVEVLKGYGVRRIVTACPHCLNTLKNEYPQLGGEFEVMHHTQLLESLVALGRLKVAPIAPRVTYHDSCYLGRYNSVYEPPRRLVRAASGSRPVEMPRHGARAFCCGGGGGRVWMEESQGRRINVLRAGEAVATGCSRVVTACPFCLTMLEDGIKLSGTPASSAVAGELGAAGAAGKAAPSGAVTVCDVAELLQEAVQ